MSQCCDGILYDWSPHWLQMFIVSYLVGSTLCCMHTQSQWKLVGGTQGFHMRVVFFHNRSQYREKGTLQCTEKHIKRAAMLCQENTIHYCSWAFAVGGVLYLLRQMTTHTPYGRYVDTKSSGIMVPAQAGWFIQELPSFLVPVLLFLTTESLPGIGRHLLLWTFCLHYFQR